MTKNGTPVFYTPAKCADCGYTPVDRDDEISHYTDPTACDGAPAMTTTIERNEFGAINITTVIDGCYYDGDTGEFYTGVRPGDKVQAIVTLFGVQTGSPSVAFSVRRDADSASLSVSPSVIGWPEG